jgi:hypothetical protein
MTRVVLAKPMLAPALGRFGLPSPAMRPLRSIGATITPMCYGRCPMSQSRRLTSGLRFAKYDNNISSLDVF